MKVLITGGLGFIGSNLVEYLLTKDSIKKIIIIDNFSKSSSSEINLSYYNPHGNTSIEYAANISTQDSVVQPPPTASDRFVRYPFITWEPMIAFLLLSIILVVIYEFQRIRDE